MAKDFELKSYMTVNEKGGEKRGKNADKLLMKMTKGGMLDLTDMVTAKYGKQTQKMGMMNKKMKKGGYKNY